MGLHKIVAQIQISHRQADLQSSQGLCMSECTLQGTKNLAPLLMGIAVSDSIENRITCSKVCASSADAYNTTESACTCPSMRCGLPSGSVGQSLGRAKNTCIPPS